MHSNKMSIDDEHCGPATKVDIVYNVQTLPMDFANSFYAWKEKKRDISRRKRQFTA